MAHRGPNSADRRGTVVVFTAVSLTVLVGFAALAIDIGYAYSVKAQLQTNADATALAGAIVLTSDKMLLATYDPRPDVVSDAQAYALKNLTAGITTQIAGGDVVVGHLDNLLDPNELIDPLTTPYNAVQVVVRREVNMNGEVPLFFAGIFGVSSIAVRASATAGVEDAFSGYRPPASGPSPLLPFSLSIDRFNDQITNGNGPDLWSWNSTTQQGEQIPDGENEIWIYPTGIDASGNFGTLTIGLDSQGTSQLGDQIRNGITEQDLIDEIGTANLLFVDANGDSLTYTMTGNPGISGGLTAAIEARVGDVVAYFVHDSVTGTGSNSQFNIIDLRFARLFEVVLSGNPDDRRVVLQPEAYSGPGIQTDPLSNRTGRGNLTLRLIR